MGSRLDEIDVPPRGFERTAYNDELSAVLDAEEVGSWVVLAAPDPKAVKARVGGCSVLETMA